MPDLVRLLPKLESIDLPSAQSIEKAQFDLLCALGEEREIYSLSVPGGSERIGPARPDNQLLWLVQSKSSEEGRRYGIRGSHGLKSRVEAQHELRSSLSARPKRVDFRDADLERSFIRRLPFTGRMNRLLPIPHLGSRLTLHDIS
jgi:hypothetical protein